MGRRLAVRVIVAESEVFVRRNTVLGLARDNELHGIVWIEWVVFVDLFTRQITVRASMKTM